MPSSVVSMAQDSWYPLDDNERRIRPDAMGMHRSSILRPSYVVLMSGSYPDNLGERSGEVKPVKSPHQVVESEEVSDILSFKTSA